MRSSLPLAALALAAGCAHALFYTGDGRFVDNGFLAYSRRFEIDLGPVDLSTAGRYTYRLGGLPRAEFVVSLQVIEDKRNTTDKAPDYPALVHVQLRDQNGDTVFDERAPLNAWVRSYGLPDNTSELHRRGRSVEVALPGGGSKQQRTGVKVSGGWGTYFHSERLATYTLTVDVSEAALGRPSRLWLTGWGRD